MRIILLNLQTYLFFFQRKLFQNFNKNHHLFVSFSFYTSKHIWGKNDSEKPIAITFHIFVQSNIRFTPSFYLVTNSCFFCCFFQRVHASNFYCIIKISHKQVNRLFNLHNFVKRKNIFLPQSIALIFLFITSKGKGNEPFHIMP